MADSEKREIHPLLILAPVLLLLLLVFLRGGKLEWAGYVRLFALLVVLGGAWKRWGWHREPVVLATVLVLVVGQLGAGLTGGVGICFGIWGGLILAAMVASYSVRGFRRGKLSALEWTAVGVGLFVLGLAVGVGRLFGLRELWPGSWQWVFLPVTWILYGRWLAVMERRREWFGLGLVGVLLVIAAVGCFRIGSAHYHHWNGERAKGEGDYSAARDAYEKSGDYSRVLGMDESYGKSRLALARCLNEMGEAEKAAAALEMEPGWKRVVRPEEWEGPTGGHLFKNVSCWKELWLPGGEVAIRVMATGREAEGEWPRMRVRLENGLLGDVEVEAGKPREYDFTADVKTGVQRLEIALLNDFWELGGGDRWLKIGQVEIEYREIDW